jgi:hypothetical protein
MGGSGQMPAAQVTSSRHWSAAGKVATQTPLLQASFTVKLLPSLQRDPMGFTGSVQRPVAKTHSPGVWHPDLASQVTFSHRLVPVQVPWPSQTSLTVVGSRSLHVMPCALKTVEHSPVWKSQTPAL